MALSNCVCRRREALTPVHRVQLGPAVFMAFIFLTGCATAWEQLKNGEDQQTAEHLARGKSLFTEGNYDGAFKENQKVFADGQRSADVALFNLGVISAYSLNPKKDYPTALHFFKILARDYPNSLLIEQSRAWIHVLEEHEKISKEKLKLSEAKRALTREREILAQERQRLEFMIEKSRQVDIEIEKRRRRTLLKEPANR